MCTSHVHNSYMTLIEVHEMHDQHAPQLFAHDLLSPSGYLMATHTHPIAGNLPKKKTLVARRLQTNGVIYRQLP